MLELLLLVLIGSISGFLAGMGAGTGFIVLITLVTFTNISSAEIAGTASTMFIFASIIGSALYTISGDQDLSVLAYILPTLVIGTQLGVEFNLLLPEDLFRLFVGIIAILLGIVLAYDAAYGFTEVDTVTTSENRKIGLLAGLGLFTGVISGSTGLGGISIIIPMLILVGTPTLTAISVALAAAVVTTVLTATRYLLQGSVELYYVVAIGVPFALFQIGGWKYAHSTNIDNIKSVISIINIAFGGYILFTELVTGM